MDERGEFPIVRVHILAHAALFGFEALALLWLTWIKGDKLKIIRECSKWYDSMGTIGRNGHFAERENSCLKFYSYSSSFLNVLEISYWALTYFLCACLTFSWSFILFHDQILPQGIKKRKWGETIREKLFVWYKKKSNPIL